MPKCLVTGGAGFVGSHLVELLLAEGHSVEVIDDLSTGSLDNIAPLRDNENFRYIVDSVLNPDVMNTLIQRNDVVFHLAAAVGVRLIVEQPVRTLQTNIEATELVLQLASVNEKRVLLTSTSEVYGKSTKLPFGEDDDLVIGPTSRFRWAYAASKIIDEFLALAFHKERGLPVTIVRLFNTIGPRQTGRYGMVVPRFVEQALSGQPISVYGDGTQRRSFTWVKDVVGAINQLAWEPKANGQVFNIGHTKDISILELAELVKKLTGSQSKIELVSFEDAFSSDFEDMHQRMPDISKIQSLVNYTPSLNLPQMLDEIIMSFKKPD